MAAITGSTQEVVYAVQKFLGLNQSPDGDTKLKPGEASIMRNFRVTRAGNLQRRPGFKRLRSGNFTAMWSGVVTGTEYLICATTTNLYSWNGTTWATIGAMSNCVSMFGYDGKAWFLSGSAYKVWDGVTLSDVAGYIPVILINCDKNGAGDELEQINKLTGKRRVRYSPDGSTTSFTLPETAASVNSVTLNGTAAAYSFASNKVTLSSAPAAGTNTLEVTYTVSTNYAYQVKAMRYAELYNGAQDTRVFLYGDGSNQAFYSGLDESGKPRADYFPDLNVLDIGESNTPITGMIRHFSELVCYKSNATYTVQYGTLGLENGSVIAAFYSKPVNRTIGNLAMGQVRLVLNSPFTLYGNDAYEWKGSAYSGNLTYDERQAKRISDRIHATLASFDLAQCRCWDDNDGQEYYILSPDGRVAVYNYAADAWYEYDNVLAAAMANYKGELYFCNKYGVYHFDSQWKDDNGVAIDAVWESGSIAFGKDYMRKSSALVWIGTKRETSTYLDVTLHTDRKGEFATKTISTYLASFANLNFAAFSFNTNYQPHITRLKLKAKKFVYYKLVFRNNVASTQATVTAADVRVRFVGYAK